MGIETFNISATMSRYIKEQAQRNGVPRAVITRALLREGRNHFERTREKIPDDIQGV